MAFSKWYEVIYRADVIFRVNASSEETAAKRARDQDPSRAVIPLDDSEPDVEEGTEPA